MQYKLYTKQVEIALDYYQKALYQAEENKNNAKQGDLSIKIGKCYEKMKNFEYAQRYYLKAIDSRPEYALAHFRLGWLYYR